ncbi:MAG: hypothetical protein V3V67_08775 [Myxococcota bacterium]
MRRLLLALCVVGTTWTIPQVAEAGAGSYLKRVTLKVVYGFGDVLYAPLELVITPVTHGMDFHRHDVPSILGAGLGLPVGFVKGQIRVYRGIGDLLTFPLVSERPLRWEWTVGGPQLPLTKTLYDDEPFYLGEDALPNR